MAVTQVYKNEFFSYEKELINRKLTDFPVSLSFLKTN